MKILRIIYDFPPPWNGLAPFPYELSLAQVEQGHQVTVICGHWPKAKPKLPPLPEGLRLIRIPREIIPHTMLITTAPLALIIIIKELLFGHYDLIQGHGHLPACYHRIRFLFRPFRKTPYYFFLHVTARGRKEQAKLKGDRVSFLEKWFEWPLHELSDRLGCKVADKIFVTGENIKEEAINYYKVTEEHITVLENGVNPHTFNPQGKNLKRELGYMENDRILLYVGTLNERKGLEVALETLTDLEPHYKLLIVGSGNKDYEMKLKTLVEDKGLEQRVRFAGYVPYPLADYYRTADILLLPSSYEGFPKVVLEALACGVPVVASGFKPQQDLEGLHLLKQVDPLSLKLAVEEDINSPVNREYIANYYSWQNLSKRI